MTTTRTALMMIGAVLAAYGVCLIFEFQPRTIVLIAIWAGVGVIVHDFVFAPVSAALGWTGRRVVKGRWWAPVAVAALCSAVLVLLAIPVYGTPGAKPDNATVLDRDYPLGLGISLALVWAVVPVYYAVTSWKARRQPESGNQLRR